MEGRNAEGRSILWGLNGGAILAVRWIPKAELPGLRSPPVPNKGPVTLEGRRTYPTPPPPGLTGARALPGALFGAHPGPIRTRSRSRSQRGNKGAAGAAAAASGSAGPAPARPAPRRAPTTARARPMTRRSSASAANDRRPERSARGGPARAPRESSQWEGGALPQRGKAGGRGEAAPTRGAAANGRRVRRCLPVPVLTDLSVIPLATNQHSVLPLRPMRYRGRDREGGVGGAWRARVRGARGTAARGRAGRFAPFYPKIPTAFPSRFPHWLRDQFGGGVWHSEGSLGLGEILICSEF